jgi:5'-deoxynucleotidase YfbR-like HD superfamily hydrolase
VAVLCYLLADGGPSVSLLMAALTHDQAEQVDGDVPLPTKCKIPGLRAALEAMEQAVLKEYGFEFALTEVEKRALSIADALDGMLYCCHEAALGNRTTLRGVYAAWLAALEAYEPLTALEAEVISAVETIWEESNDPEGPRYVLGTT